MTSIKLFVISIVTMVFFFGVITLLLPSKVTVSKSIIIRATETEVAGEIDTFEKWKNWYPTFQNHDIVTSASQKGDSSFVTFREGNQAKLSMTLVHAGPANIRIFLFGEGKNNVTYQFTLTAGKSGSTLLTWNVNTTLPWYPWKKITGIFLDKITGPQYEEVLQNLKTFIEKKYPGRPAG